MMEYTIEDIDKIQSFKTWSDRKKIDELLRIDCNMYTNLGLNSTKTEKENVKRNSRRIYRVIKNIDDKIGKELLNAMDY